MNITNINELFYPDMFIDFHSIVYLILVFQYVAHISNFDIDNT